MKHLFRLAISTHSPHTEAVTPGRKSTTSTTCPMVTRSVTILSSPQAREITLGWSCSSLESLLCTSATLISCSTGDTSVRSSTIKDLLLCSLKTISAPAARLNERQRRYEGMMVLQTITTLQKTRKEKTTHSSCCYEKMMEKSLECTRRLNTLIRVSLFKDWLTCFTHRYRKYDCSFLGL